MTMESGKSEPHLTSGSEVTELASPDRGTVSRGFASPCQEGLPPQDGLAGFVRELGVSGVMGTVLAALAAAAVTTSAARYFRPHDAVDGVCPDHPPVMLREDHKATFLRSLQPNTRINVDGTPFLFVGFDSAKAFEAVLVTDLSGAGLQKLLIIDHNFGACP